jgi:hypothetical protein
LEVVFDLGQQLALGVSLAHEPAGCGSVLVVEIAESGKGSLLLV